MATLTVSASHDYSTDALSDIDSVLFSIAAVATFAGGQFTAGVISPNVAITGSAGTNGLFINASGSFSMPAWTFSTWSTVDTITVNGSASADTITGSSQVDTIFSGDGSDTVNGGDGNDTLVGHTLANLFAQEHDTLNGGNGNDTIFGEAADTLSGGTGFDVLQLINDFAISLDLAATGFEYVLSGFGNDTYTAAGGSTAVEVYAGGGNDQVTGGSGDDRLWGGVGNDTLVGNDGNDVLVGDLGADSLSGGIGNDQLYVGSEDTFIDGGDGFDAAYIATGTGINLNLAPSHLEWVADFVGGNDTIDGSGVSVNLEVYAAGGTDTVIGGSGADFLWGQAGDDTVTGNDGNDTLVGGLGVDRLTGGLGTDALYGNSGGGGDGAVDTFVFTNNWGTDFVFDFEVGTDKLDMTAITGVHALADLTISSVDGHAAIAFGGNRIFVAGKAGQITANDFLFDAHAGDGTGEINAVLPFETIPAATPVLFRGALDFGDDPYDASDFAELTLGAQQLIALGGSSAPSEAFSFEVLNRTAGATLVKLAPDISFTTQTAHHVDYTADIDGARMGVFTTRAFKFPLGTPMTSNDATILLTNALDDILVDNQDVSAIDRWDRSILYITAVDQQAADTIEVVWGTLTSELRADTIVVLTTTYGQDVFLY